MGRGTQSFLKSLIPFFQCPAGVNAQCWAPALSSWEGTYSPQHPQGLASLEKNLSVEMTLYTLTGDDVFKMQVQT